MTLKQRITFLERVVTELRLRSWSGIDREYAARQWKKYKRRLRKK